MDDLIAFFSEMECYPDPVMQERIKMAISALEALQAEKAALVKGPIVDGPEGAARDLKAMLEALQAERDEPKQMVLTQADEAAKAARYYADSLEAGRKERTAARARIAQLEAELAGAREALNEIAAECNNPWLLTDVADRVSAIRNLAQQEPPHA